MNALWLVSTARLRALWWALARRHVLVGVRVRIANEIARREAVESVVGEAREGCGVW